MTSLLGIFLVVCSLVNTVACKSLNEDSFTNKRKEYDRNGQLDGDGGQYDWQLSTDNVYFYKMLHTLDLEEIIKLVTNESSEDAALATRRQRRSTIFGKDDRKLISTSSVEDMPYAASVKILTNRISTKCSGTLVGPRHVLTAAHCVSNGKKTKLKIGIAYGNGRMRRRKVRRVYIAKRWRITKRDDEKAQYDYAVLELRRDHKRPYMTPIPYDSSDGSTLQFNGFPGDKKVNTMWYTSCPARQLHKGYLINLCDIAPGMSGAGSYLRLNQKAYVVRAILVASVRFHKKNQDIRFTVVNPLTRQKTKEICKWMKAGSDCKSFK